MNGWLVLLLIGAALLVVVGIQVTSRQIQRFPVDTRNPGPIVETTRVSRFIMKPAELDHLHSIVTESMSSDVVAEAKLRPLLRELRDGAPEPPMSTVDAKAADDGRGRVGGRSRRGGVQWLDKELSCLEQRWGLDNSPW